MTEPTPPPDLVPVTLVPVEVFGGDCDCHEEADHAAEAAGTAHSCQGWRYGLMDADTVGSDCNRADGRIYRVDDTGGGQPGETVTVWVPRAALPWFDKVWGERAQATAERVEREDAALAALRAHPLGGLLLAGLDAEVDRVLLHGDGSDHPDYRPEWRP